MLKRATFFNKSTKQMTGKFLKEWLEKAKDVLRAESNAILTYLESHYAAG